MATDENPPAPEFATDEPVYVGFWLRIVAMLIDSVLLLVVLYPILGLIYGWQTIATGHLGLGGRILELSLCAAAFILFWVYRSATPGKMVIRAHIVDAQILGKPTVAQLILRYIGCWVSVLVLGLGFVLIGIHPRKQGLHDLMARTVVVKRPRSKS